MSEHPPKIKLEDDWLQRQMDQVREETKDWPPELQALKSINACLVKDFGPQRGPCSVAKIEAERKALLRDL